MVKRAAILGMMLATFSTGDALAARKAQKPSRPPCVSASVMPAINVYTLKTELMTAALSCGERDRYNQFVGMRAFELEKYGGMLKRGLGKKTNHFVTDVANKTGGKLDCNEAAGHFNRVLSPETELLETIASTEWAQPRHGYRVCVVKQANK